MSRFIGFLLALVITFSACCVPAYADSVDSSEWTPSWVTDLRNTTGVVAKGTLMVIYNDCVNKPLAGFSTTIATYDSASTVVGAGMSYFVSLVRSGLSPQQALNQMNTYITVNGDGNKIITGDGNDYLETYYNNGYLNETGSSLSDIGYVNYYYPNVNYLLPADFAYNSNYLAVKNLMNNNPDYWFRISYIYTGGYYWYYVFCTNQAPLGSVCSSSYWGSDKITVDLYNSNWTQDFSIDESGQNALICFSVKRDDDLYMEYINDQGEPVEIEDPLSTIDIDDYLVPTSEIKQYNPQLFGNFNSPVVLYSNEQRMIEDYRNETGFMSYSQQSRSGSLFHGSWGSGINEIEVFPTLNALKNGTLGIQGINADRLLPNYSQAFNDSPITDSQIQQADSILNNYYNDSKTDSPNNGGNGNNNNNNGGGSGSGWLDSLLNGLGSVGTALVKILGELLSIIGDAVTAIVDAISGVLDILHTGFIDMLTAVFPFLPQEFWTVVLLALSLGLLGLIIKFFRG